MELRILRYFLTVSEEKNITHAAERLHITQPTLSRQLKQLEAELGVTLFYQEKRQLLLTKEGLLLKKRAQEILSLTEKTHQDLQTIKEELVGTISIGCGETKSMTLISQNMANFRKQYPNVQFKIFSSAADEIKEKLDAGLLDMGLLTKPVDISTYSYLHMPKQERWGILVKSDSPLSQKFSVSPRDLLHIPLITAQRLQVMEELKNWFGTSYEQLEIAATYNLLMNAANMVKNNVGTALCLDLEADFEDLTFIPLKPALKTGSVLIWKKDALLSNASRKFIEQLKENI